MDFVFLIGLFVQGLKRPKRPRDPKDHKDTKNLTQFLPNFVQKNKILLDEKVYFSISKDLKDPKDTKHQEKFEIFKLYFFLVCPAHLDFI